jgi:beta-glucosidase
MPNEPLYPFGWGLSYTTFEYSEPTLDHETLLEGGELRVTTTVTNTGKRAGDEVVQLYVRDLVGSVTRPVKELRRFRKIGLAPGQSQEVVFRLDAGDLAYYTARKGWDVEPGGFVVMVGPNSRDTQEVPFSFD